MDDLNRGGSTAPLATYTEAVNWIKGLIPFGIRPGLDRIEMLMDKLGNPHRRLKFIHVAGTNGKGSTCAFLTSALLQSGYSVGTFTSPYITKFTNRFQYNNTDIPEETLLELVNTLRPLVDEIAETEFGSPTMFEVTTAVAILFFAGVSCPDVVVWETGLGGRLDVTNIVTPIVSVITNVGHDHMDILGDTLEKVAMEKAGIIKPGVPVVSCVNQPEVVAVLKEKAAACRSTLYLAGEDFSYEATGIHGDVQTFNFKGPFRSLELGIVMKGEHQISNAAGAMMVLEVLRQYMAFMLEDEDVLEGLRHAFWAGRLEEVSKSPRIVLDGAHNPEGAESLAKSLPQLYKYGKLNLLMGMMANKHHESYFKHILPIVDTLILTEPDFQNKMDAEHLQVIAESLRDKYAKENLVIIVEHNWGKALQQLKSITAEDDLAVVSGTLYLISDVRGTLLQQPDTEKGW
ncbi:MULTISPECIES: bifunctional folylpolyglutamate synthase/dihydrofolate synthase [Paenibacillus]|jgi:dihydrofolate synthase / folylpolyglutamate synthase|uniref:bifunctional folylpolyglutamate synthase/dihydrofolate synthase n=1 Tax=Paenibacillus TaxID=44249 RepID=UPI00096FB9B7|nr:MULTISPECIES: folylpolyglutamate synthase/dihydrofolate synthase family protein [Paenibacillus]MDH6431149.1 dihydrofolate synthase/folylpolyglutamate synthase [Paenibacillus sp. PastH-4]MDH6447196.1 dihydrofolate synthase/folylpolyglutamate synthase [Paenibacillus sp. PastF-4]MDH6531362.1 dihydrofolate synthase/folylpolyglutamate synthase [Paenibacillus sp. PastH-3]MEC0132099.1 bifunctional folylpolyglutamate synthase/dihydrofolate synthase [Paenibacillus odorifer]MEC0220171.1 bifunctional 